MYIGIITQEVIKISNQVENCKNSLMNPAKKRLTRPSKLYKIIDFRLKRFMVAFNF